jgi:hypothetical protein
LEFNMRNSFQILVLLSAVGLVVSCRMIETLTTKPSAGTVSSLWRDVPPFEGATKADLEIPLGARLAIRAMMQGKINFIAFTTSKSPQDVQNFYGKELMKSAGWTPSEKGCIGDTEGEQSQGVVCLFTRKEGDKREGLAIVMATDERTKQTEIFYVRADLSEPTPGPRRSSL